MDPHGHLPAPVDDGAPISKAAQRAVLVAMVLALGVLTIDVTVVRVALPTMQRELGLSDIGQQWIVNAYLIALAVLVVAGGRAGDLWGRRRVFLGGLALFTFGSVLSGAAQGEAWIIVSRAIQGAGAAVMTPGCYSIVTDAYGGRSLGRGLGALAGAAALGLSLGPLLGGVLIEIASWRWIFLINVPVAALAAMLTLRHVPERSADGGSDLDLRGLVALIVAVAPLVLALMQSDVWGWGSPAILGLLALAALGLAAFVRIELRATDPLVQLRILRVRSVAAGNAAGGVLQFTLTAVTVFLAIYLQNGLDHSALQAGLLLLPVTLPIMIVAPLAGRLTASLGAHWPAVAGMAACAVGTFWLGAVADSSSAGPLVPAMIIFGIGAAISLTVMTTAVMGGAEESQRGMVSGVYNTVRNVGAALGVAITSALFYGVESDHLNDALAGGELSAIEARDVEGLLAGTERATRRVDELGADQAKQVRDAARRAFDDAFGASMTMVAGVAALGALISALFLGPGRDRDPPA
jgi:EmrB/QacA subfamily drug resistance transporter